VETKDRATRVAVLTALRDAIDVVIDNERDDLTVNLKELSAAFGLKSIDIELPNGDKVASASLTSPEGKPFVNNEKAFIDWVTLNHPAEIIPTVRPSFKKALLEKAERLTSDDPETIEAVNPRTGEIIEGVLFQSSSNPRLTVRFAKTGRELVAEAYNRGELTRVIGSIGVMEVPNDVKGMEYFPNENLGDSPANDQAIEPQPSGALGS
jgi:hypothetical protein